MKKICRDCLKVNHGDRATCQKCQSRNLGVYYSPTERKRHRTLGSDWRASHFVESPVDWVPSKSKSSRASRSSNSKMAWTGILVSTTLILATLGISFAFPEFWLGAKKQVADFTTEVSSGINNSSPTNSKPNLARLLPSVGYNGNGQFRFLSYDSEGNPTGFHSPCEPIRYEVNPAHEPEGAREVLEAAIQSIRYYTGLQFEFVGETDELIQPNEPIPVVNPPSTLLINYYPTEELAAIPLDEDYDHVENVAGWGGPRSYQDLNAGKKQYRALGGVMALDADYIAEDVSQGLWGEPRGKTTFALMIHELAHVIGLDHVDSKSEIMYFDAKEDIWEFQSGDREGLSIAGQGACGSDAFGNLLFGEEVSELGTNVPSTCVVEELRDTHEMFELRQEGNVDDRPCVLNPFPQAGQERGLEVRFRWTSQSPENFFSDELERFYVGDRPDPIFEQRDFRGAKCNVMAIYTPEGEPIPLYWLYVVCGEHIAVVVGENFNPKRYFESPTLQAIVEHSQKAP